jgi:signal peptidase II
MRAVPVSRWLLFFSLAVGGCAADLASKSWMFGRLGMPGPRTPVWWMWQDVFGFQTSLNGGALFGMGQGMVVLFSALSVAAAVFILYYLFWTGAARDGVLSAALGCVTAGIFGNLYDRLGLPGLQWNDTSQLHRSGEAVHAVRDWILVMIGRWPWPTFNIADSLLVCGAGLLVWQAFMVNPKAAKPQAKGESR